MNLHLQILSNMNQFCPLFDLRHHLINYVTNINMRTYCSSLYDANKSYAETQENFHTCASLNMHFDTIICVLFTVNTGDVKIPLLP